jgi:hypothetical protein
MEDLETQGDYSIAPRAQALATLAGDARNSGQNVTDER